MVYRTFERVKKILQWGKLFMPLSTIRYYPPQFIIRNPVLTGVKRSLQDGHEVAVIVFHLKNLKDLSEQLGSDDYPKYIHTVKKLFQQAVKYEISEDDLITLTDYNGDSVALFIKVDYERHSISEIDMMMNIVLFTAEKNLKTQFPHIFPAFQTGYMFIEKALYSMEEAIARALRQATVIAEKRVETEFNEMVYTLRRIVSQKEIRLLAQPIIDLETKKVRALEMLTRGPEGTVLENPLPLFSVARQTGTLYDLEMVVFEKAFQQIIESECREEIFVNCTPLTLADMRFIRDLKSLIGKFQGLSPKQIIIEMTERDSLDELKGLRYNIKILRLMGFRVAVDDTGAGYASLNTISEILPDVIKIDRTLIEDIDKSSVKETMLKGLLLVAKEAGSLVVAEGIERIEEVTVLVRNKVDLAQGYFYARPEALRKIG